MNPYALWDAAAGTLLAAPGMMTENIDETLSPRDDPNIVDCLSSNVGCNALLLPASLREAMS